MTDLEMILRLGLATLIGVILGLDREMRGISAGMRTHAMVSLSSAVITVSALLLDQSLRATGDHGGVDPLRVVQGLAQAIGFIAAGAVFVSRDDVHNLTSAANLWLAAAAGIAAGAGQYVLVAATAGFGLFILVGVRLVERILPGSNKTRRD